jgi:hypothetical protein
MDVVGDWNMAICCGKLTAGGCTTNAMKNVVLLDAVGEFEKPHGERIIADGRTGYDPL